jgi:hypothetical protein
MLISKFDGDFDLLPIASDLRYRQVKLHPTADDFQLVSMEVSGDLDTHAEAHWYLEATRWRRGPGYGRPLQEGLREINSRVARRLFLIVTAEVSP